MLIDALILGIIIGSIYSLASIGYSLIYGVLNFVNFAHGEFMVVGAYITYCLLSISWISLPLAFFCAFLGTGLIGLIVERVAYRPLYNSTRLSPVISSLGVSIILRAILQLIFGPSQKTLWIADAVPNLVNIFGYPMPYYRLGILLSCITLAIILYIWINKSKTGQAIRAVGQSIILSKTVGINLFSSTKILFFVAAAVGGITGSLVALDYNLEPNMGLLLGLKGFTAAVIGGIGSIYGALLGGMVLGVTESLVGTYLSSSAKIAVTFLLLIIFIIFKPDGLMGGKTRYE